MNLLPPLSAFYWVGHDSDLRRKVQRHSPDRLLRRKVILPDGTTVSVEKNHGRFVVGVEPL